MGLPDMWAEKQAELRSFLSQLFPSSAAEKFWHLWLRQGDRTCHRDQHGISSLLSSSASLQCPPCQTPPPSWQHRSCSFPLPVWLLGGIQSWHHCPATTGLGGSGVPQDSGQGHRLSPCMALARSKMSIRSIQPITVARMVLGAVCAVNHGPWGGKSMEKDSVQSPAQSSTTSFFNKCVTLPEKLLVFSSQTRLIFL